MVFVKYWPVPNSYSKILAASGCQGAFWEDRGDRYHCGVDIYASEGSNVLSIEDGKVFRCRNIYIQDRILYWKYHQLHIKSLSEKSCTSESYPGTCNCSIAV